MRNLHFCGQRFAGFILVIALVNAIGMELGWKELIRTSIVVEESGGAVALIALIAYEYSVLRAHFAARYQSTSRKG